MLNDELPGEEIIEFMKKIKKKKIIINKKKKKKKINDNEKKLYEFMCDLVLSKEQYEIEKLLIE